MGPRSRPQRHECHSAQAFAHRLGRGYHPVQRYPEHPRSSITNGRMMTESTNPNNGKATDTADRVEQGYLTGERAAFAADGVTYVDTIFAEGQRRYVETFSAYARNFLGNMERPDVDKITGLSPVISIEQKTTNKNPRSTVGTTTEIYDFFRLLYARAGEAYSYLSGEKMVKYTEDQVLRLILDEYNGKKTYLLAPLVRNRKGHYKELFEQIRKKGYLNVRVDGELKEIFHGMKLDRYKMHSIEVVIDKMIVSEADERRLKESLKIAMKQGDGLVLILDAETNEVRHYSRRLMDR